MAQLISDKIWFIESVGKGINFEDGSFDKEKAWEYFAIGCKGSSKATKEQKEEIKEELYKHYLLLKAMSDAGRG